jgi:hypothetical protein
VQEAPQAARVKVLASGNALERRFRSPLILPLASNSSENFFAPDETRVLFPILILLLMFGLCAVYG